MHSFRFSQLSLPSELVALRAEVRTFLSEQEREGTFLPNAAGADSRFSPKFSRAVGERGWIGMTWPKEYGGAGRTALERHIVTEELLSAGAPVRAHWVADRQSGPTILKFGTEGQKRTYLPRIAQGECFFCIGMSEPDAGSDLASIRMRATKAENGWRVSGTKLWTSNAHRVHFMILFVRTSPREEADRHAGVSQFLIDLSSPGISVRPVLNLAGEHDFNEVSFSDVFVPDDMVIGRVGNGWNQVTTELTYERSGPERWLSTFNLLKVLMNEIGAVPNVKQSEAIGRFVTHLWTLQRMSLSIAGMLEAGHAPLVEGAIVKDLGTRFEQEIAEVARLLVSPAERTSSLSNVMNHAISWAPAFSIRGGTREVLRSIIAKGLGVR